MRQEKGGGEGEVTGLIYRYFGKTRKPRSWSLKEILDQGERIGGGQHVGDPHDGRANPKEGIPQKRGPDGGGEYPRTMEEYRERGSRRNDGWVKAARGMGVKYLGPGCPKIQ